MRPLVQLLLVINRDVRNLLSLRIHCGGRHRPRLSISRDDDATRQCHFAGFLFVSAKVFLLIIR